MKENSVFVKKNSVLLKKNSVSMKENSVLMKEHHFQAEFKVAEPELVKLSNLAKSRLVPPVPPRIKFGQNWVDSAAGTATNRPITAV